MSNPQRLAQRPHLDWDNEAQRFVDSVVQHLHALYGSDPRWPTLLQRSVLRVSKSLCDQQRMQEAGRLHPDGQYEQQWSTHARRIDASRRFNTNQVSKEETGGQWEEVDGGGERVKTEDQLGGGGVLTESGQAESNARIPHKRKASAGEIIDARNVRAKTSARDDLRQAAGHLVKLAQHYETRSERDYEQDPGSLSTKPASVFKQPRSRPSSIHTDSRFGAGSTSLRRSSATSSFTSTGTDLSSIFPPGSNGAAPRLSPSEEFCNSQNCVIHHTTSEAPNAAYEDRERHSNRISASHWGVPPQVTSHVRNVSAPSPTLRQHSAPGRELRRTTSGPLQVPSSGNEQVALPSIKQLLEQGFLYAQNDGSAGTPLNQIQPRPESYACFQSTEPRAAGRQHQPSPVDPHISFHIPRGEATNLPIPAKVADAVDRLLQKFHVSQQGDWRHASHQYGLFCVNCVVGDSTREDGLCFLANHRLTDDAYHAGLKGFGLNGPADPQANYSVACDSCIELNIPCIKAEIVTWVPSAGLVGKKLKLWVLPLPPRYRHQEAGPGDSEFWMME